MATVETKPFSEDAFGAQNDSWIEDRTASQFDAGRMLRETKTLCETKIRKAMAGLIMNPSMDQETPANSSCQGEKYSLAALDFFVRNPPAADVNKRTTELCGIISDIQVTRPLWDFDMVPMQHEAEHRDAASKVDRTSYEDWIPVPPDSVRAAEWEDESSDLPEWDPLKYEMRLAVRKFYERDHADSNDS